MKEPKPSLKKSGHVSELFDDVQESHESFQEFWEKYGE
jgi:hypothetical protein